MPLDNIPTEGLILAGFSVPTPPECGFPGFGVPVYKDEESGDLFLHETDASGKIKRFLPTSQEYRDSINWVPVSDESDAEKHYVDSSDAPCFYLLPGQVPLSASNLSEFRLRLSERLDDIDDDVFAFAKLNVAMFLGRRELISQLEAICKKKIAEARTKPQNPNDLLKHYLKLVGPGHVDRISHSKLANKVFELRNSTRLSLFFLERKAKKRRKAEQLCHFFRTSSRRTQLWVLRPYSSKDNDLVEAFKGERFITEIPLTNELVNNVAIAYTSYR